MSPEERNIKYISLLENKIDKLRADLELAVEALEELNIPYQVFSPKKMPRFPDEIIKEALAKIKGGDL